MIVPFLFLLGWLKDYTGTYTASFITAGSFLVLGMLVTMTLPYFWSCTAPPPPSPSKKKSQDCSIEDGLLKPTTSNSVSEKLCPSNDMLYSEKELKICSKRDVTHPEQEWEEIPQEMIHLTNLKETLWFCDVRKYLMVVVIVFERIFALYQTG